MIRSLVITVASLLLMGLATGCASGPRFAEASANFPPLAPDQGRIYFYRYRTFAGSAIHPEIRLNDEVVGESKPGGFFYVDRPAGNYVVSCKTEAEHTVTFSLTAQEVKYVKTKIQVGFFVGHIVPELEDKDTAMQTLQDCSYYTDK